MPKARADYDSMLDLPEDTEPTRTSEQSYDGTNVQSDDRTTVRKRKAKGKALAEPDDNVDRVQRSLYAKEETFKRIRRFAFDSERPAQELYREGLFLLLKKYKLDAGLSGPDDV